MIEKGIKILLAEDATADVELILRELQRAGIGCLTRRVETAVDFRRELEAFHPQVILSDFSMPQFDGMEALKIANQSFPLIPFIFVSGTIGEEHAIRALKSGARDYVLKNNLLRLPAAVERAIRETDERRARQALERELRESEKLFRTLFQNNPCPMWVYDIETLRFLIVNNAALTRYGFSSEEFLGMVVTDLQADGLRSATPDQPLTAVSDKPQPVRHRTRNGDSIESAIVSYDISFEGKPARVVVAALPQL
jgi:PAS domain S-box-containing protein